ncbi:MAG: hypothetical protein QMC35_05730, partial [Polaribacter sp.]
GGNGQLIDEDGDGVFFVLLQGGGWSEKVAAVKGQDCNTFWVVTASNNNFYSYKIDEFGVESTPVISTVSTRIEKRGYLKLSPDGTKLATANMGSPGNLPNSAILYDFNNNTGAVNNNEKFLINGFNDGEAYGVEFSADSKKIYISTVSGFRENISESAETYKLFQFDLTATNITDSKALIHIQEAFSANHPDGGYRGALQLGPDGKIYATIPAAYEDTGSGSPYLDVIENPSADALDVIFTEDAIDLDGRFATQGLPPFIASLLSPIDISDDSGTTINNKDLKYCEGNDVSFTLTDTGIITAGFNPIFEWSFDDGITSDIIATTINLELLNLTTTNNGTYSLKIKLTDACGDLIQFNAVFNLEVFEAANATQPEDIIFCDTDRNGFNDFDLQTERSSDILNGLNPTIFDVLYFESMQAANDNIAGTEFPNPYPNPSAFSSQIIYARVHNKNAPEACFEITDFKLAVTDLPIAVQPEPYRICDDLESSSDTDGIINTFLLNTRDTEVLGTLDTNQYSISYHTSQNGAEINDVSTVIPKDSNHSVTNSQTLFIRVE